MDDFLARVGFLVFFAERFWGDISGVYHQPPMGTMARARSKEKVLGRAILARRQGQRIGGISRISRDHALGLQ